MPKPGSTFSILSQSNLVSRLSEIGGLGLTPPPPDRDADRAGGFRRELQPPRRRHRQPRDLGDHGAQPLMTQPLLEAGQHGLVVAALDVDHARRRQARLGHRRREKIGARQAPQHLATRSRSDPGGEQRCRGAVDCAIAAASDFVQRAERKTAVGKNPVDRPKAECECVPPAARSLETLDALTQLVDDGTGQAHPPPSVRYEQLTARSCPHKPLRQRVGCLRCEEP